MTIYKAIADIITSLVLAAMISIYKFIFTNLEIIPSNNTPNANDPTDVKANNYFEKSSNFVADTVLESDGKTKLKDSALEYANTLTDTTVRQSVLNYIEPIQPVADMPWVDYLNQIDSVRNTNWKTSLSKLF